MTKAREIAELGQKLTVDASGNIDVNGTGFFNGMAVGTATDLESTKLNVQRQQGTVAQMTTTDHGEDVYLQFSAEDDGGTARTGQIFFDPDENTIGFRNGGINALHVKNTQKVGIGTAEPAAFLEVKSGNNEQFKITGTDTNPTTLMMDYNNGGSSKRIRIKNDDGDLKFATNNGNDRLTITEEGASVFTAKDNLAATNIVTIQSNNAAAGFRFGYQRIEQISTTTPITFDTGGSESMRLDSDNRLGLKTSAMGSFTQVGGANLFVLGSGAGNQGMTIYSGNTGIGSIAFADGTTTSQQYEGLIQYNHSTNSMAIYSNHAEAMRISSNKYVEMAGDTQIRLTLGNAGTAGTNTANWIRGTGNALGLNAASDNIHFEIGGTERMRIQGANVGIGTSSPSSILHIEGNTNAFTTAPILYFGSTSTASVNVRDWAIGPADDNYGNFHIFRGTSTGSNPIGHDGKVFTIDSSGKVGIGISSPARQLHIGAADNTNHDAVIRLNSGGATGSRAGIEFHYETASTARARLSVNASTLELEADINGTKVAAFDGDGLKMTAGKGIKFDAYGSGNILDDYEEGTWTPTIQNISGTVSFHSGVDTLSYTKVGRMVHIHGRVRIQTVSAGASGSIQIGNLPFTSGTGTDDSEYSYIKIVTYGIDLPTGTIATFCEVPSNSTHMPLLYQKDNDAWTYLNASSLGANDYIGISGHYYTNS